jgi:hypothetical protein
VFGDGGNDKYDTKKCPKQAKMRCLGVDYTFILDVQFGSVACVFYVNLEFFTLKMTLKTHATWKRTSKLHIQNASVINPLGDF